MGMTKGFLSDQASDLPTVMDIRVIKGVKIYWEIDKIRDFFVKV